MSKESPRLLYVTTVAITLRGFLLPFATYFRARGWMVDAMAAGVSDCPQCLAGFDHVWEVRWSRNPLSPQNLLEAPRQVRRVVETRAYDIVHVHTPVAAFVTRFALRAHKKTGAPRVIYTAHGFRFYRGGPLLGNAAFIALEKLAGLWTDYLLVINHEDEEEAHRYRIVPPDRLHYVPGIGVDTALYSPDRFSGEAVARVRQELGLGASDLLFLMIAEFIRRKRHEDALRAFARLNRPEIHLAFAGDGPLKDQIRQLAQRLGVSSRVHFLGFRDDVPILIRASVATLLPSEQEGLPRSIMESLSLGVPVISTDIRGNRELLSDGTGLLVKVGDVEALARAMEWMVDHPSESAEMGRRGRQKMENYELAHVIRRHEALYADALL